MAELKPARVFEQFARINQIPRPSKHEEQMIAYLKEFGRKRGLETLVDETGNVIIRKPASKGYEQRAVTVLQSHMDMVCDKLVDVDFDFHKDAIQTYVEGDWLHAKGTTLGADDGIGVAIELALLDSDDLEHGPIECVFTRDEETGLTGAFGMKAGFMTGDYLINLDSEDEGQIFVSCAGGINTTATFRFEREKAPERHFFIEASLKGLNGGHSGDDIDKKRANAIKLMARFLYMQQEKLDLRLAQWNSGKMHNAIPRDGKIVFAVPADRKEQVRADWNVFTAGVEDEFHVTDKNMVWNMESAEAQPVMPKTVSVGLIRAVQAMDNGVLAMCQDEALASMVETSSNVASVQSSEGEVVVVASQRSNVMSNLRNMADSVKAVFQLAGAEVVQNDGYPAWKMNPDSKLVKVTVDAYRKLFGKEPQVKGIHAGLECGLFSEKYPHLDMVSFGPTLRCVHTPDERLSIPTVQMVWDHLLEILKNIPAKQ
ncbi:aminoacyl-histidine dipeptidase [Prevotella dentalis DSM 3688]|uniref:Cytosol non-specific dipeptidase n=1 Tax=Prevotella dentalis (strain ATCC 49559 / DSM 3688 / JCM 13448 / NCTC 12043 / ES 2772) TaxID=908937 RepID=F9D6S7_PREDD|nr:aminoacyl-histidine dipeptidase [Prevotella dentalis]AGB29536.1 aminoacyl-histidine dipeptidase [Prevotella dentalis DSM 3688]EGQ11994.1 aminoacyl-histidine dipeptidase [Prevotella dentalis DSM 3688]